MTPLPTRIILTFPPTLSHLSLLSLSAPTPVYHLTRICPLLEFLDLSYNPWLPHVSLSQTRSFSTLDRIHWTRWTRLRILGLRRCGITWDIGKDVNKDRWVDVEIIGLDLDEERMSWFLHDCSLYSLSMNAWIAERVTHFIYSIRSNVTRMGYMYSIGYNSRINTL